MKNKLSYLFLFLLLVSFAGAQQLQLNLGKSGVRLFNGSLYAYGLAQQKQGLAVCIYKTDLKLKVKDSVIISLSKKNQENYLQLASDTLHDYLNIYLQEKEKKEVTVYRFTKRFELLATIENVDIARLNNTAMFSDEVLYNKQDVYTIKTQNDTSGKQFYLNKYHVRSDTKNFDYEFKWQFPFEKKEIRSAHIFSATRQQVLIFVHIGAGAKAGQWLVSVNAETGKLIRGTKLNSKGDAGVYMFGSFINDTTSKTLQLLGEKFSETHFKETDNKLNIANRAFCNLYRIVIDSSGDVSARQDFKVPIVNVASGAKKTSSNFILRTGRPLKQNDGSIAFATDVYNSSVSTLCYFYVNTILFRLMPGEENRMTLEKNTITSNALIEKYYFTNDKLDENGKMCIDSLNQFEKLFYKPVIFSVKQAFKTDEAGNASWILAKLNAKKTTINYTALKPVNKLYNLLLIEEPLRSVNPELIPVSDQAFIISSQPDDMHYQLKLAAW